MQPKNNVYGILCICSLNGYSIQVYVCQSVHLSKQKHRSHRSTIITVTDSMKFGITFPVYLCTIGRYDINKMDIQK